jgi:hypothetical protein
MTNQCGDRREAASTEAKGCTGHLCVFLKGSTMPAALYYVSHASLLRGATLCSTEHGHDTGPLSTRKLRVYMQQAAQPPRAGHPVLRNSFIFGGILAGLNVVNLVVLVATGSYTVSSQVVDGSTTVSLDNSGVSTLLSCFLFLVALALSFIAGMLTARASGKVGGATLAGLLSGLFGTLIGGLIGLVLIVVIAFPNVTAPPGSTLTVGQMQALLAGAASVALVFGLVVNAGAGAGTGALGGLVGRSSYRSPVPAYQPYPYPGMPALGSQPLYPYPQVPDWTQPPGGYSQPNYPQPNYPGPAYPQANYPGSPYPQPSYPPSNYPGPFYPEPPPNGQQ